MGREGDGRKGQITVLWIVLWIVLWSRWITEEQSGKPTTRWKKAAATEREMILSLARREFLREAVRGSATRFLAVRAAASHVCPQGTDVDEADGIARTIGFIGAGRMAEALIRGFASSGLVGTDRIFATDLSDERRKAMGELGVYAHKGLEPEAPVSCADVVFLAVKPQDVRSVLDLVDLQRDQLLVSVAAGVTCQTLEEALPASSRVVRVMPNTPALVGAGATAYCLGSHATEEDADIVQKLFSSVGCAIRVKETLMDAVTGLSGSGPAYCFLAMEAMADGGVLAGLPRATALRLSAQTMLGAAQMVLNGEEEELMHPGMLKDAVASPGGTTIAGLHVLEMDGVRAAFQKAVLAASKRSEELS